MLEFCDPEIVESLKFHLRDHAMSFRFGEEVSSVESAGRGTITTLASGKKIAAEVVMHSAGRQKHDRSQPRPGRVACRQTRPAGGQPAVPDRDAPHLCRRRCHRLPSARGHVDGPGQTRRGERLRGAGERTPGPPADWHLHHSEISFCGKTEEELTREAIPFEVGISRYRELARGQIIGDSYGMLKLIVHADNREILGCMSSAPMRPSSSTSARRSWAAGTVDYLVDTVLNARRFPRPTRLRHSMCPTSCELWRG